MLEGYLQILAWKALQTFLISHSSKHTLVSLRLQHAYRQSKVHASDDHNITYVFLWSRSKVSCKFADPGQNRTKLSKIKNSSPSRIQRPIVCHIYFPFQIFSNWLREQYKLQHNVFFVALPSLAERLSLDLCSIQAGAGLEQPPRLSAALL